MGASAGSTFCSYDECFGDSDCEGGPCVCRSLPPVDRELRAERLLHGGQLHCRLQLRSGRMVLAEPDRHGRLLV